MLQEVQILTSSAPSYITNGSTNIVTSAESYKLNKRRYTNNTHAICDRLHTKQRTTINESKNRHGDYFNNTKNRCDREFDYKKQLRKVTY